MPDRLASVLLMRIDGPKPRLTTYEELDRARSISTRTLAYGAGRQKKSAPRTGGRLLTQIARARLESRDGQVELAVGRGPSVDHDDDVLIGDQIHGQPGVSLHAERNVVVAPQLSPATV